MRTCPQCRASYDDEYIYCLTDGNSLIVDGSKVETVVNKKFRFTIPLESDEVVQPCRSCGNPNKASSKFCKKCGKPVANVNPEPLPHFGQQPAATVTFTPPISGQSSDATGSSTANRNLLIGGLAAIAVFVLVLVFLISSPPNGGGSTSNTKNSNGSTSSESKQSEPKLPDFDNRTYSGGVGAKNPMHMTMSLTKNGNNLRGRADTPGSWDALSGSIENDGKFFLNGNQRNGPLTGSYEGYIYEDGSLTGTWEDLNSRKRSSFSLTWDRN